MLQGKKGGVGLTELVVCKVCGTLALSHQIDGKCHTCGKPTCENCKRVCDRCTKIFCITHIETKVVMRQQKPFLHRLCDICSKVW